MTPDSEPTFTDQETTDIPSFDAKETDTAGENHADGDAPAPETKETPEPNPPRPSLAQKAAARRAALLHKLSEALMQMAERILDRLQIIFDNDPTLEDMAKAVQIWSTVAARIHAERRLALETDALALRRASFHRGLLEKFLRWADHEKTKPVILSDEEWDKRIYDLGNSILPGIMDIEDPLENIPSPPYSPQSLIPVPPTDKP